MTNTKRTRSLRFYFYVTEQERDLIHEKMREAGMKNKEAYLRKMSLDGYVIKLDLSSVGELVSLLRNATNNLNQIARRVNETRNIYSEDINDLQEHYGRLWEKAEEVIRKLAEI
jgi:protein-tyrosine-phosphatase